MCELDYYSLPDAAAVDRLSHLFSPVHSTLGGRHLSVTCLNNDVMINMTTCAYNNCHKRPVQAMHADVCTVGLDSVYERLSKLWSVCTIQ